MDNEQKSAAQELEDLTASLKLLREHTAAPTVASNLRNVRNDPSSSITLHLTTITPVYGGGTQAGAVDLLVPFRPRAIKNGIRHWWWLLNRHDDNYLVTPSGDSEADKAKQAEKSKMLYEDMVAIWGGAAEESQGEPVGKTANVSVEVSKAGNVKTAPFAAYKITEDKKTKSLALTDEMIVPWGYALFGARGARASVGTSHSTILRPLKTLIDKDWEDSKANPIPPAATFAQYFDKKWMKDLCEQDDLFKAERLDGIDVKKKPHWLVLPGATVNLTLRWHFLDDSQKVQVHLALAFWLVFGGVGARTARGLGKLQWDKDKFNAWRLVKTEIDARGESRMRLVAPPFGWKGNAEHAEKSLIWLVDQYKAFRQERNDGRKRSHWQKAEIIRRKTGMRWRIHAAQPHHGTDLLPELLFGAPIIVHFKQPSREESSAGASSEPFDTELTFTENDAAKPFNRYASPLHFGCVNTASGDANVWHPKVLYLDGSEDFAHRKLAVRIKRPGPDGVKVADISAGRWWPDFDSLTFSNEVAAATSGYASLTDSAGKCDVVEIFLDRIRKATHP